MGAQKSTDGKVAKKSNFGYRLAWVFAIFVVLFVIWASFQPEGTVAHLPVEIKEAAVEFVDHPVESIKEVGHKIAVTTTTLVQAAKEPKKFFAAIKETITHAPVVPDDGTLGKSSHPAVRREKSYWERNGIRVVLTDNTRIVQVNAKYIEVPRSFSYKGAGLSHPYWIYDSNLTESAKEDLARREGGAIQKWRQLYEEACRQEKAKNR